MSHVMVDTWLHAAGGGVHIGKRQHMVTSRHELDLNPKL